MDDDSSGSSTLSLHTIPDEDHHTFDYFDPLLLSGLGEAARLNNVELIREELSKGKNINNNDNLGNTALHYAVRYESVDVIHELLTHDEIRVNVLNFLEDSPLHIAVRFSSGIEILGMLLQAGANVNHENHNLNTPLADLLLRDLSLSIKVEMARFLLERGANTVMLTSLDSEPLMTAVLKFESKIINKIERESFIELVCMLLCYGGDVNIRTAECSSAVEYAFENSSFEVLDLIIDYIIDINFDYRENLLLKGIFRKYPGVINMINLGADVNIFDRLDSSLTLACRWSSPELFKFIWNICDIKEIVKLHKTFVMDFIISCEFSKDDFLDVLYMILDCREGVIIFNMDTMLKNHVYSLLDYKFTDLKIGPAEQAKVIYCILKYTNYISIDDITHYYLTYGFGEILEAFLRITAVIPNFRGHCNAVTKICYPHLKEVKQNGYVPSLVMLARDTVRFYLQPKYAYKSNSKFFEYYNRVQKLSVPRIIKDIICLKRTI